MTSVASGVISELALPTITWVAAVRRAMEQLLDLQDNWDGRGSGPVSPDTALFAFQLLADTMPPTGNSPTIVPLGNGALQLEWHTGNADLEIEVAKPNSVSVWYANRDPCHEQEFEITTDFRGLAELIWAVAKG